MNGCVLGVFPLIFIRQMAWGEPCWYAHRRRDIGKFVSNIYGCGEEGNKMKIPAAKHYIDYPETIPGEKDSDKDMRRKTRVCMR